GALRRTVPKPGTLINASGRGFYGPRVEPSLTEQSPRGKGFLSDLCVGWEEAAKGAEDFGVRVVLPRIGMVLGNTGGALAKMVLPFRLFLGGPISPGTQQVSWIHQKDLSDLIVWLLSKPEISGPVNAVAPETVTMKEFCRTLGKALNRPSWFPVPEFVLKVAFGEMASVMTTGQDVKPLIAEQHGYKFSYPKLDLALQSLFKNN
ncbi:MAG: TIGR01777 family oxidoreductase, partial [Nitrospirota bacterium]